MRDYLFDAVTGYFLVDMPTGWAWGPAELERRLHTIIRTESLRLPNGAIIGRPLPSVLALPAGLSLPKGERLGVRPLQLRLFRLDRPLGYSGQDNVWGDAVLVQCPAAEGILPTRFVGLRNGHEWSSEEDMWGSVSDGDGVIMQGWGDTANRPLWALKIVSVAEKRANYKKVATVEEAAQWLS